MPGPKETNGLKKTNSPAFPKHNMQPTLFLKKKSLWKAWPINKTKYSFVFLKDQNEESKHSASIIQTWPDIARGNFIVAEQSMLPTSSSRLGSNYLYYESTKQNACNSWPCRVYFICLFCGSFYDYNFKKINFKKNMINRI